MRTKETKAVKVVRVILRMLNVFVLLLFICTHIWDTEHASRCMRMREHACVVTVPHTSNIPNIFTNVDK